MSKSKKFFKKLLDMREFTIFLIVIGAGIALAIASPHFLTTSNFRTIINGMAPEMIIATGMTLSLIGGNIDFSVGSMLSVCSFSTGLMLINGVNIVLSIVLGLLVGAVLGIVNGLIVAYGKIMPLVATLGTQMAYKGLGLIIINNRSIGNMPEGFRIIGEVEFLGMPVQVIVMIVIVILGMFALKYVKFFHQATYIGTNQASAVLAGINVKKFTILTYMLTGILAAIAGVLSIARYNSAPSSLGTNLELKNVTALLLGGVSFNGGEGSVLGAFLGTLLMAFITNALTIFGINGNYQLIIVGVILIFSVTVDEMSRRKKEGTA